LNISEYLKFINFHSNEIFRFNLEQGKFLSSLESTCAQENNCCEFNPANELFVCGNTEGIVEAWDPRAPGQVGLLNCCLDSLVADSNAPKLAVTTLKFRDGLNLAVGTSTGHVFIAFLFVLLKIYSDMFLLLL
jgi:ribosome biogenesis protein ENP2